MLVIKMMIAIVESSFKINKWIEVIKKLIFVHWYKVLWGYIIKACYLDEISVKIIYNIIEINIYLLMSGVI